MTPEELLAEAAQALSDGTFVTLVRGRGIKMPKKFPRGELLCENGDGSRVYSFDPLKVLAWLHAVDLVKVTISGDMTMQEQADGAK